MENNTEQPKIAAMRQDDEMEIDLREIFFLLKSRWKSIFLAMLIGAAIFGAYHVFMVKPSYQADASIYITNTDSVITEPPSNAPKCMPATVMTGRSALFKACFHITTILDAPFALAVRI